ncbi:MAG: NACHT domain-containing protein [Collinsella sp.]
MDPVDLVGSETVARIIDWGKLQIHSINKRRALEELIEETATRAAMIPTCINLSQKFRDVHLVEELLAHRALLDKDKDEAIRTFLGTEFDKPAYDFVEAFWNSVNAIMATGEDSLAARKAAEGTEAISRKLDIICGTLGTNQLGQEDLFHHLSSYCTKLAKRDNNTNISRRLIIAGSWASVQQTTILNSKKPTLIYADPGAGKSELLKYYAAELAKDWLSRKRNEVPVFLEARGWSRRYSSLIEGIAKELFDNASESAMSLIRDNISIFRLIVDGLDETRRDRDLFFDELAQYADDANAPLICSSRFERDCRRIGVQAMRLQEFDDEDVIHYLKQRGIDSPRSLLTNLSKTGQDLMHNPLRLSCLAEYFLNKGTNSVPRNLSVIFESCIDSMIEAKTASSDELDSDYLKFQLGSYALECMTEESPRPLRAFLLTKQTPSEAERIEQAGKDSGLLNITNGVVDFSHSVLQEYLAADFLSSQSITTITSYCNQNLENPLLENFFVILCGCTTDASKQTAILDHLENCNLPLFMKCLRGRMNLSSELEARLSRDELTIIAEQALKTYTNITDRYLRKMKPYMPFRHTLSSPDAPIRMEMSYSAESTVAQIALKEKYPGDEDVSLRISDDAQGPIMETADGFIVPIISIKSSNQPETHVYRIGRLYEGIDCARELAISMINDDLKDFFGSAGTVLYEPLPMKVGFVEEALRNSRINIGESGGQPRKPSLRNSTAKEIGQALNGKPIYFINVANVNIPISVVPNLVQILELDQGDPLQYLPPLPDNYGKGHHWVCDLYTDQLCESWCKFILAECEKSYRQFIKTFMEDIGKYLPAYADGPFNLKVSITPAREDDYPKDRHIRISPSPIENEKEVKVIITEDNSQGGHFDSDFETRAENCLRNERLLGRPGNYYCEHTCGSTRLLREPAFVHNTVRNRIQSELEKLFKLN